jgi:flagellar biosynthesis chaperone FliJ
MNREVAIKKLGKMLGKAFGYRVDPKAPTADEREEAKQQLPALTAARQQAEEAMNARKRAVLAADEQYQQLVTDYRAARERASKMHAMTHHFRITVGTSNDLFFSVMAQGDSWEDVIEQLNGKTVNGRAA